MRSNDLSRRAGFSALIALTVWLAAPAARADLEWLGLRVEGGGNYMLSDYQRVVLGYEAGFQGAARPYVRIIDPITVQLGVAGYWFPTGEELGGVWMAGGGIRVEPLLGD